MKTTLLLLILLCQIMTSCSPVEKSQKLNVNVLSVSEQTIDVSVLPEGSQGKYFCGIIEEELYVSDDDITNSNYNKWLEESAKQGVSIEQVIENNTYVGQQNIKYDKLTNATKYIVYAYFVNDKGLSDKLEKVLITTLKNPSYKDVAFTFHDEKIESTKAIVKVNPSMNDVYYYTDWINEDDYIKLSETPNNIKDYFKKLFDSAVEKNQTTPEELVKAIRRIGENQIEYIGLKPESTYYIYALALDDSGNVISNVGVHKIITPENTLSDLKLQFEIYEIAQFTVKYKAIPSNDTENFFTAVASKEQFENYLSDEDYMNAVLDYFGPYIPISQGTMDLEIAGLSPDTEYYIVGFGYNGHYNTDLFKKSFRTPKSENPQKMEFDITETDVSQFSITAKFIPNDKTNYFYAGLIPASVFEEYGANDAALYKYYTEQMKILAESYPEYNVYETWAYIDNLNLYIPKLTPGTDYYLYAVAIDRKGNFLSKCTKKPIRTADRIISDAEMEINIKAIYNGDELGAIDQIYENEKGRAVAFFELTKKTNVSSWYVSVFDGEVTESDVDDNQMILNLIYNGYLNAKTPIFGLNWNKKYTICVVAADSNNNYGKVIRKTYEFKPEDADPISEYQATSYSEVPSFRIKPLVAYDDVIDIKNVTTENDMYEIFQSDIPKVKSFPLYLMN